MSIGELDNLLSYESNYFYGELDKDLYVSEKEKEALESMCKKLTCKESLENFYRKVIQDEKKPDLLGKTVEVNEKQFNYINELVIEISNILNIKIPRIFIYEEVYYRAYVVGMDDPWIEISSKVINDYSYDELKFMLGKLLGSIQCEHYKYEGIVEALDEASNYVDLVPIINMTNNFKIIDLYKMNLMPVVNDWRRVACYSTDAVGLLMSGSFEATVKAILKQTLNNSTLVDEICLKDYLLKVNEIKRLSGKVIEYSKLDEAVPYGPYRILELLRYSSTQQCRQALLEISRRKLWRI